jgi:hypothetical protein
MTAIYTTKHGEFTASRKSARHLEPEYFFAIWVKNRQDDIWTCEAYSSRVDLARARASEFSRLGYEVAVEPVTAVIKLTKRQQEFVATNPVWIAKRAAEAAKA